MAAKRFEPGKKPARPPAQTGSHAPKKAAPQKSGPGKSSGGKKRPRPKAGGRPAGAPARASSILSLRKRPGDEGWELVHPRCARDRAEDLEEVRKMIDAGELEIATDECRWLLNGCSDCLEAHRLLGEIALSENDFPLARGHFGYAFRLGQKALEKAGPRKMLPYRVAANQSFLESAKGLILCLRELDKREMAEEVVATVLECDPTDPLGVKGMLDTPPMT